ncbi:hypothetical protein [Cellulomonas sp. URHB0016]
MRRLPVLTERVHTPLGMTIPTSPATPSDDDLLVPGIGRSGRVGA